MDLWWIAKNKSAGVLFNEGKKEWPCYYKLEMSKTKTDFYDKL